MIYFVRHGLSEANVKGIFAGQKDDSALVDKGIEQAQQAGEKIAQLNLNIQRIVSSTLKRAEQTAKEIADIIGFEKNKIIYDDRITEYDMGILTGTPHHEVDSLGLISAQGAENPNIFRDRIIACVKEYKDKTGNTLFVSHGGVGRMLETIKQGKNPELFYDTPIWPNASVTLIDWVK